jgi:hypothetical protein
MLQVTTKTSVRTNVRRLCQAKDKMNTVNNQQKIWTMMVTVDDHHSSSSPSLLLLFNKTT